MGSDPFRLDDQLALVTGGGSGLGLAICRVLVEAGARVVLTGRREQLLESVTEQLGPAATYIRHDITDLASIPAMVSALEADMGPLDMLINNAGIHLKKPALDTSDAELAEMVHTHLFGVFALSRECGRRMVPRGRGSIIMISSLAALFGVPQVPAYTVAKTAVLGLTRALAVELSPHGVRVNAIVPGWIETEMTRRAFSGDPSRAQKALGRTPMARMGQAEDVGHAAVYLCSPAAKFVTGVVLPVDGGALIGF